MKLFLVPLVLAGALTAGQAYAQTAPSDSASDSPGYYIAPTIEAPPAFHGGEMTDPPQAEPFPQPSIGAPGFDQFRAAASHSRG